MAKLATAMRRPVNQGSRFANNVVSVEAAAPASRMSLRATPEGVKSFESAIAYKLPDSPGGTASKDEKTALWLGPDEWLLIDEGDVDKTMVPKLPNNGFSAVDVSHRNTGYIISGPGAVSTLNAACPRDLSEACFPVGHCSRTILGKAEVIIYRVEKEVFRVECWRSFAPYVWGILMDGTKDAHI